jgi:hypothetical protein
MDLDPQVKKWRIFGILGHAVMRGSRASEKALPVQDDDVPRLRQAPTDAGDTRYVSSERRGVNALNYPQK